MPPGGTIFEAAPVPTDQPTESLLTPSHCAAGQFQLLAFVTLARIGRRRQANFEAHALDNAAEGAVTVRSDCTPSACAESAAKSEAGQELLNCAQV